MYSSMKLCSVDATSPWLILRDCNVLQGAFLPMPDGSGGYEGWKAIPVFLL